MSSSHAEIGPLIGILMIVVLHGMNLSIWSPINVVADISDAVRLMGY